MFILVFTCVLELMAGRVAVISNIWYQSRVLILDEDVGERKAVG
jgi:hypothetical protein